MADSADDTLVTAMSDVNCCTEGEAPSHVITRDSPLLRLPAELRNHIYRGVLVCETDISIPEDGALDTPPLLAVCKQTRSEAVKIYYAENTFHSTVTDATPLAAAKWIERKTEIASQYISKLVIEYTVPLPAPDEDKQLDAATNIFMRMLRDCAVGQAIMNACGASAEEVARDRERYRDQNNTYHHRWMELHLRLKLAGMRASAMVYTAPQAVDPQKSSQQGIDYLGMTTWTWQRTCEGNGKTLDDLRLNREQLISLSKHAKTRGIGFEF